MNNNGFDYVDLGLPSGTLWATCNVGASSPEEYGEYFAWGETDGYYDNEEHDFCWGTYKYLNEDDVMTKYNTSDEYGIVDNKLELELDDDAAHVNMGGDWKMPTAEQMEELFNETDNEWVDNYQYTGINGRVFTSKSDSSKSMFIPASCGRWGMYVSDQGRCSNLWSSTLGAYGPDDGVNGYFDSDNFYMDFDYRCQGYCVRGVLNNKKQ